MKRPMVRAVNVFAMLNVFSKLNCNLIVTAVHLSCSYMSLQLLVNVLQLHLTNLLVMATQPVCDGLQPKSHDLQHYTGPFSPRLPCVMGHPIQYTISQVCAHLGLIGFLRKLSRGGGRSLQQNSIVEVSKVFEPQVEVCGHSAGARGVSAGAACS